MKSAAREKPEEVQGAGKELLRLVSSVNFLQDRGTLLLWKESIQRVGNKYFSSIGLLISVVAYGQQSALDP